MQAVSPFWSALAIACRARPPAAFSPRMANCVGASFPHSARPAGERSSSAPAIGWAAFCKTTPVFWRGLRPRRDRYFLWGRQTRTTPGEWVELRIPHRFRYPVAGNPRSVSAVVEQWCDDVDEPHFLRLCDLEPAQGTSDA